MSNEIVNLQRPFQIWEYTVGHGRLLLRSPKADDVPTRVDLLFKNVAAIHLRTTLDRLAVSEADEGQQIDPQLQTDPQALGGRKVFIVQASDFVGYVVAGAFAWHEDRGEYYDPSYFQLKSS